MLALINAILSVIGTSAVCVFVSWENPLSLLWAIPVLLVSFYLAVTILMFLVLFLVGHFVDQTKPVKNNAPLARWMMRQMCIYLNHHAGVRLHTCGTETVPSDGRFLLVGNHTSMFDPIITVQALKQYDFSFVSKPENFKIPICGGFVHLCQFLPLDRENPRNAIKTMRAASRLISEGLATVGIYPEGTRNKTGEELQPFHHGALKIAKMSDCPIVVVTTHNVRLIAKNFPFKKTDVYFRVEGVLDTEYIRANTTDVISNRIIAMMQDGLSRY